MVSVVGRLITGTLFAAGALFAASPVTADDNSAPTVILVVGAPGTPEYEKDFAEWAEHWQKAAASGGANLIRIGSSPPSSKPQTEDRGLLQSALKNAAAIVDHELWVVFIGHGTFDRRTARFNLRGTDVSATELSAWLKPVKRPVAIINCASASGPFINALSARNRVVVTATKNGSEQNFSRFGKFLSSSIAEPRADLDKDGQTSLLEAWLMAARQVEEFYKTTGRLATEHSLLEDNGDGRAVRADFFRGIRPVKKSAGQEMIDGYRAHQFHLVRSAGEGHLAPELRRRRDELELAVIQLRNKKATIPSEIYLQQLESALVQLGEVYERIESGDGLVVPASGEKREQK